MLPQQLTREKKTELLIATYKIKAIVDYIFNYITDIELIEQIGHKTYDGRLSLIHNCINAGIDYTPLINCPEIVIDAITTQTYVPTVDPSNQMIRYENPMGAQEYQLSLDKYDELKQIVKEIEQVFQCKTIKLDTCEVKLQKNTIIDLQKQENLFIVKNTYGHCRITKFQTVNGQIVTSYNELYKAIYGFENIANN